MVRKKVDFSGENPKIQTRDDALAVLSYVIEIGIAKMSLYKQPHDLDSERNLREWCRTSIYACNAAISSFKSKEEEQLELRISTLEKERALS